MTSKGGTLAAVNLPNPVSGNTFNADNGMTAFGGATLSYDANGNLRWTVPTPIPGTPETI